MPFECLSKNIVFFILYNKMNKVFPTRVTEEEHKKLTPVLMKRILKNTKTK